MPEPTSSPEPTNYLTVARRVMMIESQAVARVADSLDESFSRAVAAVLGCRGRVVVTGIGKSGAIGRKLASTFASTGTPALFLHAAEGLHGDLGMVAPGDILLAISYSGRSDELLVILPVVKSMGVAVIALTGNPESYLGTNADIVLQSTVEHEACPLNLAPTASTTAALALGDALAVTAMEARGFKSTDFARFHPGGTLGRGLTLRVSDLMRTGDRLASVEADAPIREALERISQAQAGAAVVVDAAGKLAGYLTDGDVRRHLLRLADPGKLLATPVREFMTRTPLTFRPEMAALDALRLLQERRVDDAPVVDENDIPVGWLDEQELLKAGVG